MQTVFYAKSVARYFACLSEKLVEKRTREGKKQKRSEHQYVSIIRPPGYEPGALPLRHDACSCSPTLKFHTNLSKNQ